MMQVKKIWLLLLLMQSGLLGGIYIPKLQETKDYIQGSAERVCPEDEELMKEIWHSCGLLYKSLIDISGLYFSGLIVDTNQLYHRMFFECGKHLFQVMRVLAVYGPRMLQNPDIPWQTKLKKTAALASVFVVFWIWSQEVGKTQQTTTSYDTLASTRYSSYQSPAEYGAQPYRPSRPVIS